MPDHREAEAITLRKLRALVGMPVLCGSRRIGRVVQARLNDDLTRLEGLWVSGGLMGTRHIPAESLQLIGDVAVMADDAGRRCRSQARPLLLRAVSTDGRRVGAVTGATVDEVSFAVTSLELSRGFWDDLLHGRASVRRYAVNPGSGEVVIQAATEGREGEGHEGRNGEGTDDGHADRRIGGDDLRRHELADRAEVEPAGQEDGQLDLGSR